MKFKFFTDVKNGRLSKVATDQIRKCLESFEGKRIEISICKKINRRSNEQNRYLWGAIYPILKRCYFDAWGEYKTIEEIHEEMKLQFNYKEKVNVNTGEVLKIAKGTSENSTMEQEEYHSKLRNFAKEWFNTEIPLPNSECEMELE